MAQQPLFGYSPEQIMQARQAAMQERAAAEARNVGGGWAPLYEQARGLSMMGAEALGRGLFPQAQDPALQRAQVTQSIVQKYRGQDFNSPSVLSQMASEFSQAGLPELAMELGDKAKQLTSKASRTVVAPGSSVIDEQGNVLFTAPDREKQGDKFKVTAEFLKLVDPKDRPKVIDAANRGEPIPTNIAFLTEKDSAGTEFERLIAGLPPEEQKRLKAQYLQSKVTSTMSPSLVPVALKEQASLDNIAFGASDISKAIGNLKSGTLKLGLKENFVNSLKTLAGKSDEGSKAFSQFNVALETLRNARLNLNVGVQTEGDAVRAANEFLANYDRYDTQTALTQLERVYGKLENAYKSKQGSIKQLYSSSGTALPDSFFNPFPKVESGKPTKTYTEDQLKAGFEKARQKYPKWNTLGYDAYKKQLTGQK